MTGSVETAAVRRNIESILPLLPNQRALLLLRDLQVEDPGFLQVQFTLEGEVDLVRLRRAWDATVQRHPALRMSIRSRKQGDPLAVVWRSVDLPWEVLDWGGISDEEQQSRKRDLLAADRAIGLDVSRAPAMRLTVLQLGPRRFDMVWTCHHLFSDGWSAAVVLEDVMAFYLGDGGPSSQPADALQAYVRWATNADREAGRAFWRKRLAGFRGLPALELGGEPGGESGLTSRAIDAGLAARVTELAADLQATPNAIFQAAWAIVLGGVFGADDVVFGTTASGRSAPVEGMERLVGYFSNAVPVRARLEPEQSVRDWIRALRHDQFSMLPFESTPLSDVQESSDLPGHQPLFETFLVFENFPTAGEQAEGEISMSGFRSGLTSAFPLTLAVTLEQPWQVHVRFLRARVSEHAASRLAAGLVEVLGAMCEAPDGTVGRLASQASFADLQAVRSVSDSVGRQPFRPARTDTERGLVQLWHELLGVADIGVDDDYFALGGTSLLALRLFDEIDARFGISLPLRTLINQSTIAGLAAAIDAGGQAAWQCLVPFRTDGSKPPVVCLHGGGGDVLFYRQLAERLGDDQPVYGMEPVGLDGREAPIDSIPAMAERYITELKAIQPAGPYRFVGYCFGGAVGLEMARQLGEAGDDVDLLVVIDGGLPLEAARATGTLERARVVWQTRGALGAVRAAGNRLRNRSQLWWDGSFAGAEGRNRAQRGQVAQACDRAFGTWEPTPASVPVTLIKSRQSRDATGADFHFGWDQFAPSMETVDVDVDHYSLFDEPAIDRLAEVIRSRIGD